jgi:L-seryl-tRNA(Ser) seleniumtransferase
MDREGPVKADARRALPSVDRLARALREASPDLQPWIATEAARRALAAARAELASADAGRRDRTAAEPRGADPDRLLARALALARRLARPHPSRVVNATGVVLHTNLGRAVLAEGAVRAVAEAASGYSDLELDLERGERGNRLDAVCECLALLAGAEAAFAVNNNAAAVLLAVSGLARDREVVVSRGELVEIGGSFRLPELMAQSGARLVEVGTTNRTHPDDYRRAIGPDTGLLLKVHRSNFEQRGFVAEVDLESLVAIGREAGVPVVEDLGSATLVDLRGQGLPPESFAPARLASGVDVLCFSGDKLLGGPQAGLLLGRREVVETLRRSPLARALRLDKLSLAALDWTLRALLDGRGAEIPTLRALLEPAERLEARARALAERLARVAGGRAWVTAEPARAPVGGGSLPGFELDGWVVALRAAGGAEVLAAALRRAAVPVLGRVSGDRVLLDLRTLLADDALHCEKALAEALQAACDGAGGPAAVDSSAP